MPQRSNGQLPEAAARQLLIGVGAPVPPPKLAGLEQPQRQEPALPSWQTPEQAPRQVQNPKHVWLGQNRGRAQKGVLEYACAEDYAFRRLMSQFWVVEVGPCRAGKRPSRPLDR